MLLPPGTATAAGDRGWGYLIDKLIGDGLNPNQVTRAFQDPRMPPFTGLEFSPQQPREPMSWYRRFVRPSSVAKARSCRAQHADAFLAAEQATRVPASVLAAILFIESGCGGNTGSSLVFYRLARLAMANEPDNLQRNLVRLVSPDGTLDPVTAAQVHARARYLEQTFYPEVRAAFAVAAAMGVDLLDIRGSASGAFGTPQFLPTSFLQYGTDGDGDGRISLYDTFDAAASASRYLVQHGWRSGLSRQEQRQVIWNYNRSAAYIGAVLTLAARIDGPASAPTRKAGARTQQASRTRHRG